MHLSKLDRMKTSARASIQAGQWDEARRQLEKICRKFPRDFDAWCLLGAVCGRTHDVENAILACRKAVSLQPDNAGALHNYGMALVKAGRTREAVEVYRKSLASNPDSAATHHMLGNALKHLAEYDEAIRHLEQALRLEPARADAWFSLGSIHIELGSQAEAFRCMEKCVALDPNTKAAVEYFLSPLSEGGIRNEAGRDHVRKLHDNHADIFNHHLTQVLEYRIPRILREEYDRAAIG